MNYYNPYNFNQNNSQPGAPFGEAPADAVYIERKRLRRAGNAIGGGLLIFLLIPFLAGLVIGILPYVTNLDAETLNSFFSGNPGQWVFQNFLSVLVFTLPFVLAAAFYGQSAHKVVMFAAPKKGIGAPLVLMGLGACGVANWMVSIFETLISYDGNSVEDITGGFPQGIFGIGLVFLSVCAVAALVEEYAFRGVVLGILRNVSEPFAIVMSALLFGLMHSNFSQMPYAFMLGLAMGFAAVKSGSIWPACLIHFIGNLFSVVMSYASAAVSEESLYVISAMFYIVTIGLGILGVILFVKKEPEGFRFERKEATLSGPKKFAAFMGSPCIIIFVILALLQAIGLELSF